MLTIIHSWTENDGLLWSSSLHPNIQRRQGKKQASQSNFTSWFHFLEVYFVLLQTDTALLGCRGLSLQAAGTQRKWMLERIGHTCRGGAGGGRGEWRMGRLERGMCSHLRTVPVKCTLRTPHLNAYCVQTQV